MSNNTSTSTRFHFDFTAKAIVGSKASFDKAGKGVGPVYDELVALMAKHPDFACAVRASKKPAKPKQTYHGMDIVFMLDYASAVNDSAFRAKLEKVRDFLKKSKKPVYPTIKRMFMERFAPDNERFDYETAKVIVSESRYKGIITAATTHTVSANNADEGEALAPAA